MARDALEWPEFAKKAGNQESRRRPRKYGNYKDTGRTPTARQ